MADNYAEQYQWIKGDRIGNIEIFAQTKDEWIYFQSGKRINSELLNEFMIAHDPNNPVVHNPIQSNHVAPKQIEVAPGTPGTAGAKGVQSGFIFESGEGEGDDLIRDAHGKVYDKPSNKPEPRRDPALGPAPNATIVAPVKEINPVALLIGKSKKDKIILDIQIELELPKKGVYDVINDSFDIDLNEEIIKDILTKIKDRDLRENFKKSLEEKLNTIYK